MLLQIFTTNFHYKSLYREICSYKMLLQVNSCLYIVSNLLQQNVATSQFWSNHYLSSHSTDCSTTVYIIPK